MIGIYNIQNTKSIVLPPIVAGVLADGRYIAYK
jgi:hypothetical protein